MRIYFDSKLIGSPANFIWEDGQIIVNDASPYDWHFTVDGPREGCIRAASEAAGCSLLLEPKTPQVKFWKKHVEHPAWYRIIPRERFGGHLKNQVTKVVDFLHDPQNDYFLGTFQNQQRLLDRLQPGRVRDASLSEQGFIPDPNGFVRIPMYDNTHSATGRMSIKGGPKILTLQRELRSGLTSRWDDGVLVEIDFNSLEARVLNWIVGNQVEQGDLYSWIGNATGAANVPRNVIKEATLAAIYGMTRKNFALRYQDMPDALDVYESVRKLLKVQELETRLRAMSHFKNAFGRPLPDTTAWISYHVQSSAVDVACSGFLWLVNQLNNECAVPIYLIHDAIILDVKLPYLKTIQNICKDGLNIDIFNQTLPVKVRQFNHE